MRLVFVNRFYRPDESATSQLLTELAEHLAAQGREVHVVTSRQLYGDAAARLPPAETLSRVDVHRVWSTRFGRARLPGRALDYLSFCFWAWVALLRILRQGDVVVAKTDPPLVSVVAAWAARVRRARLVNWLQDLFPEVAERLEVRGVRGPLGALLRALRDRSLRAAAVNVVPGHGMRDQLVRTGASAPGRVTVIHNWSDGRLVKPVAREANALRRAWGLEGRFVLGYSGNMGRAHDFATFLEAAEGIGVRDDLAYLFVGGGNQQALLRSEVSRRALASVFRFEPYQPRERLAESLGAPDLHLVTLKPELEGLIVPSKFYGIAAAARPALFVGDPDGEVARLLREFDCGIVVAAGDAAGLAAAVRSSMEQPARLAAMGLNARRAFEAHFDKPLALRAWTEALGSVTGATPAPIANPDRELDHRA